MMYNIHAVETNRCRRHKCPIYFQLNKTQCQNQYLIPAASPQTGASVNFSQSPYFIHPFFCLIHQKIGNKIVIYFFIRAERMRLCAFNTVVDNSGSSLTKE